MKHNWEQFHAAYAAATPHTQTLVDSEFMALCVDVLYGQLNLDPDFRSSIMVVGANLLLGINTPREAELLLAEFILDHATVTSIVTALNTYIESAQAENTQPEATTQDFTADIAAAEAALGTLPPIRTMQSDHDGPTYSSTQAALLQESATRRDIPQIEEVTPEGSPRAASPRWGSDQ